MATLKEIFELAKDNKIDDRIVSALRRKANYVLNPGSPEPSFISRQLAKDILKDVSSHKQEFRVQISDNVTAQTEAYLNGPLESDGIPDGDIIYIVDVTWDLVASLHYEEPEPESP